MTQAPVTFLHFTDLHIGDHLTDDHLHSDTTQNMKHFKEMARQIQPQPAFVLATGDLANLGDLPSYLKLRELMADIGMPVLYALGNHDVMKTGREGFYEGMLGRSRNTKERYFHDALLEGIHIVMLDTSEPGKVGGSIGPEQFEWLEATLKSHGHAPKLIGIHHPPSVENNPRMEWESITWKDSVRLAELIAPYNVAGIMCGHLHSDRVTNWHGIPVVMSTGPHLALDPLLSRHVGIRMLEGTSFGLCTIRPSGLEVNFVPLPASRNELHRYDFAQMKWAQSRAEAAAAE